MTQVLGGLEDFGTPYIDNAVTFSLSWEKHIKDVVCVCVLGRLGEAKLTVKPSKCRFAQDHVRFF